jgi:hypothetical protein
MKKCHSSLLSLTLVALMVCGSLSLAQDVPCAVPAPLGRTNGAAWPQGTVTVIIDPTDFPSKEERDAIKSAFTTWQNANPNSGVNFSFTTGPQPTPGSEINTYYVHRGPTEVGGDSSIGFSGSLNTAGNKTQSAVTVVNSTITRLSAITAVMVHEIGHTFGLDDCLDCVQGSTVMSTYRTDCFCPSNPCDQSAGFNGIRWGCPPLTAPRPCEVAAVAERANYPPPPTPTPTPSPSPTFSCNDFCPNVYAYWPATCFGATDWCAYPDDGCGGDLEPNGRCCCTANTPIIIDLLANGFSLTNFETGVSFDLGAAGLPLQTSWTETNSDDAFLALDRNGNGLIDNGSELFGNATPQPQPTVGVARNGFVALAEYDRPANGGNADGIIDRRDGAYEFLRLWRDLNHNGVSEPAELNRLLEWRVDSISLDFKKSRRLDKWGNGFRYRSRVDGSNLGRWAYDVIFQSRPR